MPAETHGSALSDAAHMLVSGHLIGHYGSHTEWMFEDSLLVDLSFEMWRLSYRSSNLTSIEGVLRLDGSVDWFEWYWWCK